MKSIILLFYLLAFPIYGLAGYNQEEYRPSLKAVASPSLVAEVLEELILAENPLIKLVLSPDTPNDLKNIPNQEDIYEITPFLEEGSGGDWDEERLALLIEDIKELLMNNPSLQVHDILKFLEDIGAGLSQRIEELKVAVTTPEIMEWRALSRGDSLGVYEINLPVPVGSQPAVEHGAEDNNKSKENK